MPDKIPPKTNKALETGDPSVLGAAIGKQGVNFAVYSEHAHEVFLLLFDTLKGAATDIIPLNRGENHVWHVKVLGLKARQLYGYKIRGPYDPRQGMRFNSNKLLIDPYAKAIKGVYDNHTQALQGYDVKHPDKDLVISEIDSSAKMPKSVVIGDDFDWQDDRPLHIPLNQMVIYEVHVKGFTAHPSSGVREPGTYLGFIEKIPYLKKLGINAVELLPVQHFYRREGLLAQGLNEYWGYNTIGFFAPESSYASASAGGEVQEFKTLVRELHKAGIEVILDVVYNHTGEGNEFGPTLCFRGLDNATYYSLIGKDNDPYRFYLNDTGCGNTFNIEHPAVMRLVLESLRYWVEQMHVDGFRFDLASILARVKGKYAKDSLFFKKVQEDPVLSQVKLIAEPWDLTTYQIGNFPKQWSEWNGKFRDTVRRFNKGDQGQLQDLAWRLTGSADLYGNDQRSPFNSINFITCHDGFTLHDLYAYNAKHNEANQEENRDGTDENSSWNLGAEGETSDAEILRMRKRLSKNALCLLIFSIGTPMILAGDEFLRSQKGNNNAYCQDNELTWLNWDLLKKNKDIFEFCQKAIAFRKRYPVIQRDKFLSGTDQDGDHVPDVLWFNDQLQPPAWTNPEQKLLCYQLDGSEIESTLGDYHLFFILNAYSSSRPVKIPRYDNMTWFCAADTSLEPGADFKMPGEEVACQNQNEYLTQAYTVVVLIGEKKD